MGFFDFLKKKAPLHPPAENENSATAEPKKRKTKPQHAQVTVPEGHAITIHNVMPEPSVSRTPGGVVLVNFGVAGDDPDVELEAILRQIGAMLDEETQLAHLVNVNRVMRLDELFAPANPDVLRFQSPISWNFHIGSVASLCAEPRRLQAVLRCMYDVSKRPDTPIQQCINLVDPPSPDTLPFVRLARGLGLVVKQPDDREDALCVVAEVTRPEGPILCTLAGKTYPSDDPPDHFARDMNEQKARAAASGQQSEILRLEEQELEGLAKRVRSSKSEPQIISRAPRIRQLILEANGQNDTTPGKMRYGTATRGGLEGIINELLTRNAAFLFMQDRRHSGIEVRTYGPAGRALPVFADLRCLRWAAEDLGKKDGSFDIGAVHPLKLIAMAADDDLGIAICTYRDRQMPMYAIVPDSVVKTIANVLARGKSK